MVRAKRLSLGRGASFLVLMLLVQLVLGACAAQARQTERGGSSRQQGLPSGLGERVNSGPVLALRFEAVEDTEGAVVYREVRSLEELLTQYQGTELLCIYQPGSRYGNDQIITYMEQLAERYGRESLLLLVAAQAEDSFLERFAVSAYPSFFLVKGGRLLLKQEGWSPDIGLKLEARLEAEIRKD